MWLSEISGQNINETIVNTMQSGVMYLHGRDMQYRCTIIVDLPKVIELMATHPDMVSTENMSVLFAFLWSYMKKCMFLPGQADHWNTITNMGFASMWALPRAQVFGIADMCQNNMMFMLNKSFYVNTSWG